MSDYQIKKPDAADFWKLLKIVRKGGKEAFAKIDKAENTTEQGLIIFDVGMEFAEQELKEFLAGMANLSVEEFDKQDFSAPLDILIAYGNEADLPGFFKKAVGFFKKFSSNV